MRQLTLITALLASAIFASAQQQVQSLTINPPAGFDVQRNLIPDTVRCPGPCTFQDSIAALWKRQEIHERLLRFNTDMGNYYIQQVQKYKTATDSLINIVKRQNQIIESHFNQDGIYNDLLRSLADQVFPMQKTVDSLIHRSRKPSVKKKKTGLWYPHAELIVPGPPEKQETNHI